MVVASGSIFVMVVAGDGGGGWWEYILNSLSRYIRFHTTVYSSTVVWNPWEQWLCFQPVIQGLLEIKDTHRLRALR